MKDNKRLSKEIKSEYTLRPFENSRDPTYAKALAIYIQNITPSASTQSNEITSWLDRTYREFGDDLCILGFLRNRLVIGWVMMAFFSHQRILLIDYLVLNQDQRVEGQYSVLAQMLKEWVDGAQFEYDFVVAEVSFETTGAVPSERSIALVELFKRLGFAVADCEYHQAPLGLDNPESEMRAHLLLTGRGPVHSVKQETLLRIVETIYFSHNLRWYSAVLKDIGPYEEKLRRQFESFRRSLANRKEIVVNGIRLPHLPMLPTRAPHESSGLKLTHLIIGFAAISILSSVLLFLEHHWNLGWEAVDLTVFMVLIVFVSAATLFLGRGGKTLNSLLQIFRGLSDTNR